MKKDLYAIPDVIKEEVEFALSHYPELADTPISFRFKKDIKKSTMQAQPEFRSFFKRRGRRSYKILISEKIKIADKEYLTVDVPKDVMIGWIGHELGHVMDYKNRGNGDLIVFGAKYLLFQSHIKNAEREADAYAVSHGLEKYIIATKEFILNRTDIAEEYKERIKKYYLSPEEIMQLVQERDSIRALENNEIDLSTN